MKARHAILFSALLATLVAGPFSAIGGHREGNGGDYIRSTFIRMGQAVVQHLTQTEDGQALVDRHDLDLEALKATLTIDVVKVSDQPLRDNGDSVVDALGEPGSITLSRDAWAEYLERERDVYFLVFHEMLRAAGRDDDDYVISGPVRPFPLQERVATSIMTLEPLIQDDDLSTIVVTKGLVVAGSGCPSGFGTLIDVDVNRNVLELRVNEMEAVAGPSTPMTERRKNCQVVVPVKLPSGKKLVITQVDAHAELALPQGASFTVSQAAYFQGQNTQSKATKTVKASAGPVRGRTLLRSSGTLLSYGCNASERSLVINLSGFVSANSGEATGRVLGSSLYLQLQNCGN